MTDNTDLKTLQASVDHIHLKMMSIYGELMTSSVHDEKTRQEMKRQIFSEWAEAYSLAKRS